MLNRADTSTEVESGRLSEPASKALLSRFGIRVPKGVVISADGGGLDAVGALRPPFAVKVVASGLSHKTDAGGVRLNVPDISAVARATAEMLASVGIAGQGVDGFLVEEMAPPGVELVIGGLNDPQFGPLVMVGIGGIFVEIFRDVQFRACPLGARDAEDMLTCLRGRKLLEGARGAVPPDRRAIVEAIVRIGGQDGLLSSLGERLGEVDVNPLIAGPGGAVAADARIVLGRP